MLEEVGDLRGAEGTEVHLVYRQEKEYVAAETRVVRVALVMCHMRLDA